VRYVEDSEACGDDPFCVVYPSLRSKSGAKKEEGMAMFIDYLIDYDIDMSVMPNKTRKSLQSYVAAGGKGKKVRKWTVKQLSAPIKETSLTSQSDVESTIPPTISIRTEIIHSRPVNLATEAAKRWKSAYGQSLPSCDPVPMCCKDRKTVHELHIDGCDSYVMKNLPPCALLDTEVREKDDGGLVFKKKQEAKRATYWWIVVNVGEKKLFVNWAKRMLDGKKSVRLNMDRHHEHSTFATICETEGGDIVIEHGGEVLNIAV
jgi:hypothetical protein